MWKKPPDLRKSISEGISKQVKEHPLTKNLEEYKKSALNLKKNHEEIGKTINTFSNHQEPGKVDWGNTK